MIKSLKLKNFTVFRNTCFTFGQKINIITGENGTGKSHLIKALYAMDTAMLGDQVNHLTDRIRQSFQYRLKMISKVRLPKQKLQIGP